MNPRLGKWNRPVTFTRISGSRARTTAARRSQAFLLPCVVMNHRCSFIRTVSPTRKAPSRASCFRLPARVIPSIATVANSP